MNPQPHILITAYAVNPYKGSEDGTGWNWVSQAARFGQLTVITRENNLPHIQRFLSKNPDHPTGTVSFIGFDLPKWQRFWKRGGFGALLYYALWQRALPAFIRRQGWEADLVHALNFHNDWIPSHLGSLGKPFIWGPIGHHPLVPEVFMRPMGGVKGLMGDRFRWSVKQAFWKWSGALRRCIQQADLILGINSTVARQLPGQPDVALMPAVGAPFVSPPNPEKKSQGFSLLSVGRFVPLKGFDLTLRSFAKFWDTLPPNEQKEVRLRLVGKGPIQDRLEALAKSLGIHAQVDWINWMPQAELFDLYRESDVFLFPSHEGAGMVIPEAFSYGLPAICLANCGPGESIDASSGIAIPYGEYDQTVADLSHAITHVYHDNSLRESLSIGARKRFEDWFDWQRKGDWLGQEYARLLPAFFRTEPIPS